MFRNKITKDSEKKKKVINDLKMRVGENNLTNSKMEMEMSIIIKMLRKEKDRARFLSLEKVQEDQEIAEIRSSIEARVILVYDESETTADLKTKGADDDNDNVFTKEIELNGSLDMGKLLDEGEDKAFIFTLY